MSPPRMRRTTSSSEGGSVRSAVEMAASVVTAAPPVTKPVCNHSIQLGGAYGHQGRVTESERAWAISVGRRRGGAGEHRVLGWRSTASGAFQWEGHLPLRHLRERDLLDRHPAPARDDLEGG